MDHGDGFDPVRLSKLLAFVLRHRPDVLGLALDEGGWVEVATLVERLNARRRLPFAVDAARLEALVRGEGRRRFELEGGRVRARGGHTVAGVRARGAGPTGAPPSEAGADVPEADGDPPPDLPEFLFLGADAATIDQAHGEGALLGRDGAPLRLFDDEAAALEAAPGADIDVVVIDAGRAARQGAVFAPAADGALTAMSIPLRFLLSLRADFERQVSAGGVLVKGRGAGAHFALIRTLPREQVEEPPDIADARAGADRRLPEQERRRRDDPPPGGVERRGAGDRRQRRRRRSARWAAEGRLELPKGKLEPGETPEQAAVREVREELGIDLPLSIEATLATNHYVFRTPEQRTVFKTVHYYLLACEGDPAFQPRRAEGIVSVEWWPGPRAISQVAFRNLRPVLERAWDLAQKR